MPKEMFYSPWGEGAEQSVTMSREEAKKLGEKLAELMSKKKSETTPTGRNSR